MRIDFLALYQRSLLGGLGGLVGWALITTLVHIPSDTTVLLYLRVIVTGALIGLGLGAACGVWDGLFRERSLPRMLRGAGFGAAIGFGGGAVGLAVGEMVFGLAGGGLFSRAIGWAVFGALVGTNEGVSKRMPQKTVYGAFGGLLGGLIGGSTYEFLATAFQAIGFSRDVAIALGGAVGLVLLGMFIGCLIGLVEDLLRAAWLVFMSGRYEGQTRTLDPQKSATTIGRSDLADICILADAQIVQQHARLIPEGSDFVLEAVEGAVQIRVGQNWVPVTRQQLANGDVFQIGSSRAKFQTGAAS